MGLHSSGSLRCEMLHAAAETGVWRPRSASTRHRRTCRLVPTEQCSRRTAALDEFSCRWSAGPTRCRVRMPTDRAVTAVSERHDGPRREHDERRAGGADVGVRAAPSTARHRPESVPLCGLSHRRPRRDSEVDAARPLPDGATLEPRRRSRHATRRVRAHVQPPPARVAAERRTTRARWPLREARFPLAQLLEVGLVRGAANARRAASARRSPARVSAPHDRAAARVGFRRRGGQGRGLLGGARARGGVDRVVRRVRALGMGRRAAAARRGSERPG